MLEKINKAKERNETVGGMRMISFSLKAVRELNLHLGGELRSNHKHPTDLRIIPTATAQEVCTQSRSVLR